MTADTPPPHRPGARTTGAYARARSARAEDACPHGVRLSRAGAAPMVTGLSVHPLPYVTGSPGPYSPYNSGKRTLPSAHAPPGAPVDPARAGRIRPRSRPTVAGAARPAQSLLPRSAAGRAALPAHSRRPSTRGAAGRVPPGAQRRTADRSTPRMIAHGAGTPPEPPVQGRSAKVGSVFGARRGNVVFRPYRGDLPAALHPPPHPHSGAAP